ncbi:ORF6N domain-containing protein [Polaribacter sp. Z014]|uniref:ORF6N domain-containing protein n=1 Tax=Polaribacter sp. Z014 TaxID=2927126 RepID=UPI0020224267|nr:ORF6N domain-containing protein [Polaribacter sp. Z014]MCL7763857.1 ORF6N domain-containing protein [Polaribacter sp. Z014]
MKKEEVSIIPDEIISNKIYLIRNQKVMLDRDLADLYQVETKRLKEAVRRNINRFPDDFMFEMTKKELENWRTQIATSNSDKMGLRYAPMVFTEQGVAMLSSVLKSDRAITVNIKIIRIFTKMRNLLSDHLSLRLEIEDIKKKMNNHDKNIELVFSYLDELVDKKEDEKERTKIGFKKEDN